MTHEDSKQVWRREDLAPHDKLVLLALADHTDKQSQCYSSKARLCRRTGMSARGVQVATKRLIGRRLLSVEVGAGRGGTNLYTLHLAPSEGVPSQEAPPASDAPRMECAPAQDVSTPRQTGRGAPAPGAAKPLLNHQEPSEDPTIVLPAPKTSRRACALPEGWVPSNKNIIDAQAQGFSEQEISYEADRFRDHHLAKGTRNLDWDAALLT